MLKLVTILRKGKLKMKEIKIETADLERLSGIYPEMTEKQLYEIALGEKEGVQFSLYADKALSPEEMAEKRETLTLSKKKAITAFECRYFYGTMKYFDMVASTREMIFESLIDEKNGVSYRDIDRWASSNGQLQGKMMKIYETLTKDKTIKDIFDSAERLPEEYAGIIKGIKVEENAFETAVSFPLNMRAKVYKTFGKGAFDKNENVMVTPETRFVVKNKLSSYSEAHFSISLESEDLTVAIATTPNRSAIKADADLALLIIDKGHIYYDNASKYMDVKLLVKGLRS